MYLELCTLGLLSWNSTIRTVVTGGNPSSVCGELWKYYRTLTSDEIPTSLGWIVVQSALSSPLNGHYIYMLGPLSQNRCPSAINTYFDICRYPFTSTSTWRPRSALLPAFIVCSAWQSSHLRNSIAGAHCAHARRSQTPAYWRRRRRRRGSSSGDGSGHVFLDSRVYTLIDVSRFSFVSMSIAFHTHSTWLSETTHVKLSSSVSVSVRLCLSERGLIPLSYKLRYRVT